jgi:hypothetical protein
LISGLPVIAAGCGCSGGTAVLDCCATTPARGAGEGIVRVLASEDPAPKTVVDATTRSESLRPVAMHICLSLGLAPLLHMRCTTTASANGLCHAFGP